MIVYACDMKVYYSLWLESDKQVSETETEAGAKCVRFCVCVMREDN